MPSFDVVSKIDQHEVTNAVDQANRELKSRFDFKDTDSRLELGKDSITIIAPTDFQLKQVDEIFRNKLAKREIDIRMMDYKTINTNLSEARQEVSIKQGIDQELAKKIVTLVKESKVKVQASIQGEHVRVTGKNRDDLQEMMTMLRGAKLALPLQFENFRD